jgi:hypothetical protein
MMKMVDDVLQLLQREDKRKSVNLLKLLSLMLEKNTFP